ncbi:hypothetical protein WN943_010049 [Citrus x changshan-huyou]
MCCRCLGRLCMHDCLSFAAGNVRRILHMASVGNDCDTTNKTGNYYLCDLWLASKSVEGTGQQDNPNSVAVIAASYLIFARERIRNGNVFQITAVNSSNHTV